MKIAVFLALVVSSSAVLLQYDEKATYEGKVSEIITEEAAFSLCKAMNAHMEEKQGLSEKFFSVPIPQTVGDAVIWFKRAGRGSAIATLEYKTGCYHWEMRPCYGYYPNSFSHPCTFWIPRHSQGGNCIYDFDSKDMAMFAQKAVTLDGKTAAQLCATTNQALNKRTFSMTFIYLKLNLRSTNKCETWKYTPGGGDDPTGGKWDLEAMPDQECDQKFPDFDLDEMEDPEMGGVTCISSLNGEYECFFKDDNMPVEVQIEIQNKPNTGIY